MTAEMNANPKGTPAPNTGMAASQTINRTTPKSLSVAMVLLVIFKMKRSPAI